MSTAFRLDRVSLIVATDSDFSFYVDSKTDSKWKKQNVNSLLKLRENILVYAYKLCL